MKPIKLIGGAFALALVTATACMAPGLMQSAGPPAAAPIPPNVLDAYIAHDAEKADDVRVRDQEVDQIHSGLFRELLTYMMEDPRNITPCTHLLFMAKNIERAGDHVTNIAELVSFRSTGQSFAEARRKGSGALYTTDTAS